MDKKTIGIGILILIVIVGGAFYGGMKYAEGNRTAGFRNGNFANLPEGAQARFGQAGSVGAGNMRGGALLTTGEIIAKDEQSITVKLQDGGSRIVFLSASTPIMKATTGSPDDLAMGINVTVTGTANSDGSVTAESVQIRPAGSMPFSAPTRTNQ
jgi:hypothetical protein